MRVTGGELRGRRIAVPRGRRVRPTSDRVRESLFQLLTNLLDWEWEGVVAVDLFAGSGSLGIEALSRGASRAVFVDSSPSSCRAVAENLASLGLEGRGEVVRQDAFKWLATKWREVATGRMVILADPPYRNGLSSRLVAEAALLQPAWTLLAVEEAAGEDVEGAGPQFRSRLRCYGDTCLHLFWPED